MKIKKAVFDLMPKEIQSQFKPNESGDEFDNGEEDVVGLKSALEKEKASKKQAAEERDAYKSAATKAEDERKVAESKKAAENGDFSKLEESYKKQLADSQEEIRLAKDGLTRALTDSHNENVISSLLPNFISTKAGRAILEKRIKSEIIEGKAVTRFLDDNGNVTTLDSDGFKKILLADSDLKGILVASKAGGGGSTPNNPGGGTTGVKSDFNPSTATGKDMVAHLRAKHGALPGSD